MDWVGRWVGGVEWRESLPELGEVAQALARVAQAVGVQPQCLQIRVGGQVRDAAEAVEVEVELVVQGWRLVAVVLVVGWGGWMGGWVGGWGN